MRLGAIVGLLCLCWGMETAQPAPRIAGPASSAQTPEPRAHSSQPLPQLTVETRDLYTYTLKYHITAGPASVTAAWIEVWDRPQRLLRQSVEVSVDGKMDWADISERTPAELHVALLDPDATQRFICIDNCTPEYLEQARRAPSSELVVGVGPDGNAPPPHLQMQSARITAGGEARELMVTGIYFTPESRLLVDELDLENEQYRHLQFLPLEYVDMRHLKVWLPATLLLSPRLLMLSVMPPAEDNTRSEPVFDGNFLPGTPFYDDASVDVVCKASPQLDHLEPADLRADAADNPTPKPNRGEPDELPDDAAREKTGALLKLHGSGFNKESRVTLGYTPLESQAITSEFVSPDELRIWLSSSRLKDEVGQTIPLWVINDKEGCGNSDSRTFRVLPTEKIPSPTLAGSITVTDPYPVPLITQDGPKETELILRGENFRPNDTVVATTRGNNREYKELKTVFLSSEQLRVWLPRAMWRVHRLSFRFVIRTAAGERAIEVGEPGLTWGAVLIFRVKVSLYSSGYPGGRHHPISP